MNRIERLDIVWSTSRGRDTYGYNICKVVSNGGKWSTCGGGYDMVGTAVGNWFADVHQEDLKALVASHDKALEECGYQVPGYRKIKQFYGLTLNPNGEVTLDGGCGINSMENIIKACGFDIEYAVNRRGNVTNYFVQKVAV